MLALASLQLPKESEIITPACTFSTTLAPIIQLGLKPVFVDVGVNTYVAIVEEVISKINDKTRALMIPNLIGNKPDWKALKSTLIDMGRADIILIEDSADTITHTPETDIATTSFYASHIITAGGSGGMVMFNDEKYLKVAAMYRDWGRIGDNSENIVDRFGYTIDGIPYDYKFLYGVLGYNFKCSEMNAAFGLVQLDRFEKFRVHRRNNILRFENLKDVKGLILPDDSIEPNWLAIPLLCDGINRMELLTFLENEHIQTRVCFAGNVTRHPVYRQYLQEFKNSDNIMANAFLLGAHHGMTPDDVDYVCSKIKEFLNK